MTGFKIRLFDCAMILGAVLAMVFCGFSAFAKDCEEKPNEVLRMHILANSDSAEDQELKYRLRDHILVTFGKVFDGCRSYEDAVQTASAYKAAMQEEARRFILSSGYDYNVTCEVEDTYFTTRNYEKYTLPAGSYTAVRFLIGEAEGRNWWCVMFPPLCLPAAGEFFTEEQSRRVEESKQYEVKFALFEFLNGIFGQPSDDCKVREENTDEVLSAENELARLSLIAIGVRQNINFS